MRFSTCCSIRRDDLTPAEWREGDERATAISSRRGRFSPTRRSSSKRRRRVPVLIGGALFDARGTDGVAFALDLSERKRTRRDPGAQGSALS